MKNNKLALIGFTITVLLFVVAVFAPQISPHDPYRQNLYEGLNSPSKTHIFGQDRVGRDLLSRVIYGSRISLLVGFLTVLVSLTVGVAIGSISGYIGGITDEIIMRICDIFLAFPGILMAISIMAILGPSLNNVIIALCVFGWVGFAKLTRAQVISIKEMDFVLSAKAVGSSHYYIISKHIIPNIMAPLIVEATFGMAGAILAEAGLSFLGLGIQPPIPSWGTLLNEGRRYMLISPHLTLFPGLAIMTIVLGINFLGDGLRDYLDPKN